MLTETVKTALTCLSSVAALLGLLLFSSQPAMGEPAVRVWEGKLDLPTYALGEEDPNPPFPLIKGSHVYPYTMLDDLTDRRETKSYPAVFLENESLKATVLPSLGGRLYSLYDKVNRREVFYRNHVVKYGLVGLRGAWISGGVEFNFPDGHTVVTVSPVAWAMRSNPDGSATVVVGDIDRVTGMHWEVALTLRPGEARLEQRVTLSNPTPLPERYWYWANAAVPASDDMQFIYPMREAYPHARWPVFTYPVYKGVDYSWYKNVRQATSLFARQAHRDFFGAYYHAADYGVVHVADFRQVPGKKTWTWGVAPSGLTWTGLLTDHDGPYNEIQAGRFETQLNYEFMPSHHVESWTEYWYPVVGLGGGFVAAEKDLALNVIYLPASSPNSAGVQLSLSSAVPHETVTIRPSLGTQVLPESRLTPLRPLSRLRTLFLPVTAAEAKTKLTIDVLDEHGATLLHWSAADPVDGNPDLVPAADAAEPHPPDPGKMTVEELFRLGVAEETSGHDLAAHATFQQVLERDSGYVPALLKIAWWDYRAADFAGAEQAVRRALERAGDDPEVHYAAGVVYRATGRPTLAEDAFWSSIRFGGPEARALVELGELAIADKDNAHAVELLRRALEHGSDDALALADLAVALRLAGKSGEAAAAANHARLLMPLLPFARAEAASLAAPEARASAPGQATPAPLAEIHPPDDQDALEVAAWYRRLGDYRSADAVLEAAPGGASPRSPLVDYYLASDARAEGDPARAEKLARQAASASGAKVFPQRVADAVVLAEAVQADPLDVRAKCDLANFLFAHSRYREAAQLWLGALGEGFDDPVVERNLGVFAWRVSKDLKSAAAYYQKAVKLAPMDYRLYVDLDSIQAEAGDTAAREKLFAHAPAAVLDRDTVRVRRAMLLVAEKRYDEALAALAAHRFKPWEGGEAVRQIYVLANLERGKTKLRALSGAGPASRAAAAREAEQAFRRALDYPAELGVGKPDKPHDEAACYWLGEALEAEGKSDAAREAWKEAVAESQTVGVFGAEPGLESRFYAALALGKLGQASVAEKALDELEAGAEGENPKPEQLYVAGLVERFRQRDDRARRDFQRALEIDPAFWQARLEM